ncbi:MAG TPA: PQQ-dependent sugar dehydrogenase [Thermoanaerobaculia bacterium]|nr:PQQ-dependent sugar dehydrogenase [Thermoanaerobaculia bacterium]
MPAPTVRKSPRRALLCALAFAVAAAAPASAQPRLLPGFQDSLVVGGLTHPTVVRFSPDGRMFVAEKSGLVKVFPSLYVPQPSIFADLTKNVDDYWDRGLLGMALDPGFPQKPYVYVLYAFDAPIGGTAPVWNDGCPTPPGPNTDGCVVSGRLSRLTASGSRMSGGEKVLVNAWGQQFPSHSVGSLQFGFDGALYASAGEGASLGTVDYGQFGGNPLGDPPGGVGGVMQPPWAEGGALRSQSLRRRRGEPAVLNGTVIRVDPATGNARSDNPLAASADANARRIVAYGFRNPFRFTIRPGTGALWIGDDGTNLWEEINVAPRPASEVKDFGWPCFEGAFPMPDWVSAQVNICMNDLYRDPSAAAAPWFAYRHSDDVVAGDGCAKAGSSVTGLAFYGGGSYPTAYDGALFFADHTRNCTWVMFAGSGGDPDPSTRTLFIGNASHPVDLEIGPGGDLYYVDYEGGAIRRVQYGAPTASAVADRTEGAPPLTVKLDGTGSHGFRPGDTLSYAWDFNGDGDYSDSADPRPTTTITESGVHAIRLRVTDERGVSAWSDPIAIAAYDEAPEASIDAPAGGSAWSVGDAIRFSGHAADPKEGALPSSAMTWTLVMHHCPSGCHTHDIQTFFGVSGGTFNAPDHEYPSSLELRLTAVNSLGIPGIASVYLPPKTAALSFDSLPRGLKLDAGDGPETTPFSRTVIAGSRNTVSASGRQTIDGRTYLFRSWSDGGEPTHVVDASAPERSLTAIYQAETVLPVPPPTPARIEGRPPGHGESP